MEPGTKAKPSIKSIDSILRNKNINTLDPYATFASIGAVERPRKFRIEVSLGPIPDDYQQKLPPTVKLSGYDSDYELSDDGISVDWSDSEDEEVDHPNMLKAGKKADPYTPQEIPSNVPVYVTISTSIIEPRTSKTTSEAPTTVTTPSLKISPAENEMNALTSTGTTSCDGKSLRESATDALNFYINQHKQVSNQFEAFLALKPDEWDKLCARIDHKIDLANRSKDGSLSVSGRDSAAGSSPPPSPLFAPPSLFNFPPPKPASDSRKDDSIPPFSPTIYVLNSLVLKSGGEAIHLFNLLDHFFTAFVTEFVLTVKSPIPTNKEIIRMRENRANQNIEREGHYFCDHPRKVLHCLQRGVDANQTEPTITIFSLIRRLEHQERQRRMKEATAQAKTPIEQVSIEKSRACRYLQSKILPHWKKFDNDRTELIKRLRSTLQQTGIPPLLVKKSQQHNGNGKDSNNQVSASIYGLSSVSETWEIRDPYHTAAIKKWIVALSQPDKASQS